MKYLVTMELIGTPPAASPQEHVQFLEQVVIPEIEAYMKLEAEKKILAGGPIAGARAGAFIVDVASNEELNQLLQSLPLWHMTEVPACKRLPDVPRQSCFKAFCALDLTAF